MQVVALTQLSFGCHWCQFPFHLCMIHHTVDSDVVLLALNDPNQTPAGMSSKAFLFIQFCSRFLVQQQAVGGRRHPIADLSWTTVPPLYQITFVSRQREKPARPAFAYILRDDASSRNAFSWKLCTTSTNKPEQSWIAGGVLLVLLGVLNLTCTDSLSLTETHKLVMVSLTLAQIHLVSSRIAQIHSDH